jgi:hypothetical protein
MPDLDGPSPVEQRRERVPIRKETAMPVTRTRTVVLIGASFHLAVKGYLAVREWHEFRMTTERELADGSFAGAHALPEVR